MGIDGNREREEDEAFAMDESFEVRVKRLFGSHLFETVPNTAFPSSSWSVAGGEVERREWNRERGARPEREDFPCASAFDDEGGCFSRKARLARSRGKKDFEADLDDLDGEDEEGEEEGEEEEREIRSSVGLDPTLDNEEEEDEYDRAAFFQETTGERLYMRDIKDHGPHLNYHAVVSDPLDESFNEIDHHHRDPRADHLAARERLNEDKESGGTYPLVDTETVASDMRAKITETDVKLKPILKRKDCSTEPGVKKRVRFDPAFKDSHEEVLEEGQDFHTVPQSMETNAASEEDSSLSQETPAVPDYLKNPSKYTCYTFDTSDYIDEETNRHAFEDFRSLVGRSISENPDPEFKVDLPMSITFTPKRKRQGDHMSTDDNLKVTGEFEGHDRTSVRSVGIAVGEDHEGDNACEMEEDGSMETNAKLKKQDRKYRSLLASDST